MEAGQPFSDSDITSTDLCSPVDADDLVPPADVAALSRLSAHFRTLLQAPERASYSDARILVKSAGEESSQEVLVHRCVLSARSPFFRDKFATGETVLELGKLVGGFEVGYEALVAVIQYVYTGRLEELPRGEAECIDDSCHRHEACWPAIHFMLQVLHAASAFKIGELVSVFQRRLLDILEKVTVEDTLEILFVANLSESFCQKLLVKCIEIVGKSDIDYITLEKKIPSDVVTKIEDYRKNNGHEKPIFPDKQAKSICRALDSDDIELVELLLNEGNTNLDAAKALHYAVAFCDLKTTNELLNLNLADVNGKNHRKYTVLHIAAMRKEPEIIMSLLKKGARPMDITPDGRTALQLSKRFTKSTDYNRSTEKGKSAPKEQLCIEMLERAEMRDSTTEVTSLPAEMSSENPRERLSYLEMRVRLAECLFPAEAKAAMTNANLEGTPIFKAGRLSHLYTGSKRSSEDVVKASSELKEEDLSRIEALTETVRPEKYFFPRCSRVVDVFLDLNLSEQSGSEESEHLVTEEQKRRYKEILGEISVAYAEDKNDMRLGKYFFPRCSRAVDALLDGNLSEQSGSEGSEHLVTEEQKRRYNEILSEISVAYAEDKNAFQKSSPNSASSSKSARSVRAKIAKK